MSHYSRIDEIQGIYVNDDTGEIDIENLIDTTYLPLMLRHFKGVPITAQSKVLELGYGSGAMTDALVRAGYSVTLVEGSRKLCDHASDRFGNAVEIHCSLFEHFSPPCLYHQVLALHVLEHVEDLASVLINIYKWMEPGGRVIAVVPNSQSLHRQLAVMMGLQEAVDTLSARDHLVGHKRVMNMIDLELAIRGAGFNVTHKFGYFLKVVPNSMMRSWPPNLLKHLTSISDKIDPTFSANIGVVAEKL
ncbi:MAG: class I SAM-dependent methyltransferase [Betaproteobacteria bacterium]|nr:class I SAM-dependent methyltransferase [Betaproteobacteria bacterium]